MDNLLFRRFEPANSLRTSTLDQIRSWTDECLLTHAKCNNMQNNRRPTTSLPARLLEIGSDGQNVRIQRHVDLLIAPKFVTFSHCWGVSPSKFRLYQPNLNELCQPIPLYIMPKTFREAVEVTWRLGYRYSG
jgi:hypothetical protein